MIVLCPGRGFDSTSYGMPRVSFQAHYPLGHKITPGENYPSNPCIAEASQPSRECMSWAVYGVYIYIFFKTNFASDCYSGCDPIFKKLCSPPHTSVLSAREGWRVGMTAASLSTCRFRCVNLFGWVKCNKVPFRPEWRQGSIYLCSHVYSHTYLVASHL